MPAPAAPPVLGTLAQLLRSERAPLLAEWRQQVRDLPSAKHLDVPTLNDHIPELLEELAEAFEGMSDEKIEVALVEGTPREHGIQRVADGFDLGEVVAEYSILRGCVHDLADAHGLILQGKAFHILNKVFDTAIGLAVETHAAQRAKEVQQRREEYLAFIAHDLRTPLNAISLAASVLDGAGPSLPDDDTVPRIMQVVKRNASQLGALVNKVLEENNELSTDVGVKLVRRRFDLWALVGSVIHDIKPIASEEGTRLLNEVPYEMTLHADANLMRRIFQNLISNAIRYTPSGEVRIGAALKAGDTVECWVRDNGSGIPAHLVAKVFDKGAADAARAEGSGLGLAIVKSFVEAHGGTVHVDSEEGKGCAFLFVLPSEN